jgi:hypothetical protein
LQVDIGFGDAVTPRSTTGTVSNAPGFSRSHASVLSEGNCYRREVRSNCKSRSD